MCMCVQLCASEHEKEVKRRNGSTRVTGSNYVYIISVYAEHGDCSQIITENEPVEERMRRPPISSTATAGLIYSI